MKTKDNNKKSVASSISSLIMGGTTMLGLGAGFILLERSALAFIGCLMVGIGLGLVIGPIATKRSAEKEIF
jgi:hypothetical protein